MTVSFHFTREALFPLADAHEAEFRRATPFPHVVLDHFLPDDLVAQLIADYPSPAGQQWFQYRNERENLKFTLRDEEIIPPSIRHVVQQFNSQVFVEFLERLTGITGLIVDPGLIGGGLHQTAPGGLLKVHADFNQHPDRSLDRRLNVLLYLNPEWRADYGGELELWDRSMTTVQRRILPTANRLVIFATTSESFHGHPEPLRAPSGMQRRSIALFYYTAPRVLGRRGHSSLFRSRPGEGLTIDDRAAVPWSPRDVVRAVSPPILLDVGRALRTKARRRVRS